MLNQNSVFIRSMFSPSGATGTWVGGGGRSMQSEDHHHLSTMNRVCRSRVSCIHVVQGSTIYVLWDKTESIQKAHLPRTDVWWLAGCFRWRLNWLLFLRKHQFCLEEQLIDKLWLLRVGYLADIFSNIKKVYLLR